ncbi:MAG TPA: ABC transporter ATP-binding protein [Gemmatimonadaceae bacterium]|nr:ABC transporter ATP-binding protein [Gemmatimonadaceae bacterium]
MPAASALRRLVPYYRPYPRLLAGGLALVIISSALGAVVPWLLRIGIDDLRAGAPLREIWTIAAGIVAVALFGGALRYWMRELLNGLSRHIEYDLRQALFVHLTRLDGAYFARMRTGDLMARLTNDLGAVRMAAGPAIMYLTNTIFGGAFALVFMLRIDVRLTLLALLPMVLLPIMTIKLGAAIHRRFEAVQEEFSALTTLAQENFAGVRVVRAYRQERAEIGRFAALNASYLEKNMELARLYGVMNPMFGLLAGLSGVMVLGFGGSLAVRGTITVGAFVAFGFYLGMLTWPLIALGWVVNLFQRGAASMTRLLDILDAQPDVHWPAEPQALPPAGAGRSLEFRDVGFHFPVAEGREPRWVLRHVSFTVPAGETLAVVGATGSGKSALIDLIPRLTDPQEGEILLDGVPLRDLALDTLRAEIGYVPQESFLFSDTIAANLAYGDATHPLVDHAEHLPETPLPSRTGTPARPRAREQGERDAAPHRWAAQVAQLDDTVREFEHGYGTVLGERGINLSGGQKQRLALARALARRPRLVLLDDALSAVDTHTEAEILHGLRGALAGRTAVIASHRVSAVRDANQVIVLHEGHVVERGTHATLISAGGRYATLLQRQQLEESLEEDVASVSTTVTAGTGGGGALT